MRNVIAFLFLSLIFPLKTQILQGAWSSKRGNVTATMIITQDYLTVAEYKNKEFIQTWGGTFQVENDQILLNVEFHSSGESHEFGKRTLAYKIDNKSLEFNGRKWDQLDNGSPGDLLGAWIITKREVNGEMTNRPVGQSRKTMKVLSGTRFQWIAYDIDSKSFMGSGGGTYTTSGGKYTENIDFFSRDNSRVGASLEFDFERKDDNWFHRGLSSKGRPINEVWSIRK